MLRSQFLTCMFFVIVMSSTSHAKTPILKLSDSAVNFVPTGPDQTNRSVTDSVLIIGPWNSTAPYNGQFQTQIGNADWNGWTHRDLTANEGPNHWHADSYNAEGLAGHGAGNLAAWCGTMDYPSCDVSDPQGGYGNNWRDHLSWTATVLDPQAPSVVTIDAWVSLDTEPDYDFLNLLLHAPGAIPVFQTIATYDGTFSNQHLSWEISIPAGEYSGINNDEVNIRFEFYSDAAWSDEDCDFVGVGACQIDDITVHLDNGNVTTFDDFESGELGNWVAEDPIGKGDFSQLKSGLRDQDPCSQNDSPQVCFIDDGVVVPETGGTPCIDFCYGPGGYIVNNWGGLIPDMYNGISNGILSPVLPWPENYDGGLLEYDAYVHETHGINSPIVLCFWHIRSTSSPNPEDISSAQWRNDNYYYFGGPEYRRYQGDFSQLIVPEAKYVQVRISMVDYNDGHHHPEPYNGTPAPYFDNVRVCATMVHGPEISLPTTQLANDAFPSSGVLDLNNLSSNSVRFDSVWDANSASAVYEAQDYISANIVPRGDGVSLETTRLHYRLIPNPVFDSVRNSGLPNSGYVNGSLVGESSEFHFDLPDTGFFYPGDIIHYYFSATQSTPGGDETTIAPADTTGFSQNPMGANSQNPGLVSYNEIFIVRALPVVNEDLEHAKILVWDDASDPGFTQGLRHDLNQAQALSDFGGFDLYRKMGSSYYMDKPFSSAVTSELLAGYTAIFYFSGSSKRSVLGGDAIDHTSDFQLLADWLESPNSRGMFVSGDYILSSLTDDGQVLLNDYLGVGSDGPEEFPQFAGLHIPEVIFSDAGYLSLPSVDGWLVNGYCTGLLSMSAAQSLDGAVRLAEFADPSGQGGAYPYSALTVYERPDGRISFSMPYDFRRIQPLPGWSGGGLSLRSQILLSIAGFYTDAVTPNVDMTPVPDELVFSTTAYPNPFNPSTTINFTLPRSGDVSLKIFNVRGELVKTVVAEPREAGYNQTVWSGDDKFGKSAASGVYFYELRFGRDVLTEKLMLIK